MAGFRQTGKRTLTMSSTATQSTWCWFVYGNYSVAPPVSFLSFFPSPTRGKFIVSLPLSTATISCSPVPLALMAGSGWRRHDKLQTSWFNDDTTDEQFKFNGTLKWFHFHSVNYLFIIGRVVHLPVLTPTPRPARQIQTRSIHRWIRNWGQRTFDWMEGTFGHLLVSWAEKKKKQEHFIVIISGHQVSHISNIAPLFDFCRTFTLASFTI